MLVSLFDDLSPISAKWMKAWSYTFLSSTITKSVFILAKSADTDETPRIAASHLGQRCLYTLLFRMHSACSTIFYFDFRLTGN